MSRIGKNRQQESCQKLVRYFRSASLLKAVSYSSERLSTQETISIIPEIGVVEQYFHAKSLEMWNAEMIIHNKSIYRGLRMKLNPIDSLERLTFSSLDLFMVRMNGHIMAQVLDAYSTFAERVFDEINRDRSAMLWCVCGPVIITSERWLNLCSAMSNILKLMDCEGVTESLYPWPDLNLVHSSSKRARQIFDKFAIAVEPKSLISYESDEFRDKNGPQIPSDLKRRRLPQASVES